MISHLLASLSVIATTYGYGEKSCYSRFLAQPVSCLRGLSTATGENFDPLKPTFAMYVPKTRRIRSQWIGLKVKGSAKCVWLWLNDRKPKLGLDLTPGALKKLGIKPNSTWSGMLQLCTPYTNHQTLIFN